MAPHVSTEPWEKPERAEERGARENELAERVVLAVSLQGTGRWVDDWSRGQGRGSRSQEPVPGGVSPPVHQPCVECVPALRQVRQSVK